MKKQKSKQFNKIIVETLVERGVFAISDIEKKSILSREGIGKKLRKLVQGSILQKTAQKGTKVRYKLAINNETIKFLFESREQVSIDEISSVWDVSVNSAKKYIKKFVDNEIINKIGKPPQKIIYIYARSDDDNFFTKEQRDIVDKYYIYITPDGQLLQGVKGFIYWAKNKSGRKDFDNLAQEYINVRKKYYDNKIKVLMIDATDKLKKVFGEDIYIKKLFHRDFDALPIFGKTNLSQMVRTAKSGRTNIGLMNGIVDKMQNSINEIIDKYGIDCVGFIPPTVARKTQLMAFIDKRLDVRICKKIGISKIKSLVPVQQKSLKKVEDRILNAKKTIVVENDGQKYENVLLIDDVTGSGATLNETAKKIIKNKIAKNVYAFTITGSAKAGVFDVISEA